MELPAFPENDLPAGITKPGGSIRIAAASSRGITMSETFDRPVVVGYIAYDRPIAEGGRLGSSTPTLLRVEQRPTAPPRTDDTTASISTRATFGPDINTHLIAAWLNTGTNREMLGAWLRAKGNDPTAIPAYLTGTEFSDLRRQIVEAFAIGGTCGT